MSRECLRGELEELGERLKIEFGIDRQLLTPEIEDRLWQLRAVEESSTLEE